MNNAITELRALQVPDADAISAGPNAILRMAESFAITSAEDYSLAAEELRAANAKLKALEERRLTITRPMDAAKKAVMDLFAGPTAALEKAVGIYKRSMLAYTAEQERIAAEAKRKAEEEAAAERRRLEEEARKVREAAEAEQRRAAQAEAERQAAARAEHERLAREAAEAKARGDAEAEEKAGAEAQRQREADAAAAAQAAQHAAIAAQNAASEVAALEQVAQVIVAPVVAVQAVKAAGISTAKGHDFEVENLVALIKDVAAKVDGQPGLASVLMPDTVRLRALVKALGPNLGLAGVRVFEKRTMRAA